MRPIKLELHCPIEIDEIVADPKPNWSLDGPTPELNPVELKLGGSPMAPVVHITKQQLRELPNMKNGNRSNAFVMRVTDDDMKITESYEGAINYELFSNQKHLPFSLHCSVKEEIRNRISLLETDLRNENDRLTSAFIGIEKYAEGRREFDRKLDLQHCRKLAEALDNHLLALRRDDEHRSQKEEGQIRNDAAAFEDTKRKENARQEEVMHQEKAKAEVEAAKQRDEEAHQAALEAERRGAKTAADKEETSRTRASGQGAPNLHINLNVKASEASVDEVKDTGEAKECRLSNVHAAGIKVKATESALRIEAERLLKLKEVDENNKALRLSSTKDFSSYELQIAQQIKQKSGGRVFVSACADELIKTINDPLCPQSITVSMFAKEIVSQSATAGANNNSSAFACGHLIVLVTAQVPLAMDLLLAEFHKACIYTVPKYLIYSEKESSISKEAYYQMMGYRDENGRIENKSFFLERIQSYMRLYGALVQTEVDGVENRHGLKEGWTWLARFSKAIPANIYTAVALEAFLRTAGFALFKKYKSQFMKIVNFITHKFVDALQIQAENDPELNRVMVQIKFYFDSNAFLIEPLDWRMENII